MLVYQKTMFDRYYCIKSFCHLKTLEKRFEKSFLYYYNGTQKDEGFVSFEKTCSREKDLRHPNVTKLCSFICTLLLMTFLWQPGMGICSTKAVHQEHVRFGYLRPIKNISVKQGRVFLV